MAIVIRDEAHALEQLAEWYKLAAQVNLMKKAEMDLRVALARFFIPNMKEGTNKYVLPDGAQLTVTQPYNYKVDKSLMAIVGKQLAEIDVNIDDVIEMKPSLKTGEMRKLSDDAKDLLSQCVDYTIGSPSMKVEVK